MGSSRPGRRRHAPRPRSTAGRQRPDRPRREPGTSRISHGHRYFRCCSSRPPGGFARWYRTFPTLARPGVRKDKTRCHTSKLTASRKPGQPIPGAAAPASISAPGSRRAWARDLAVAAITACSAPIPTMPSPPPPRHSGATLYEIPGAAVDGRSIEGILAPSSAASLGISCDRPRRSKCRTLDCRHRAHRGRPQAYGRRRHHR